MEGEKNDFFICIVCIIHYSSVLLDSRNRHNDVRNRNTFHYRNAILIAARQAHSYLAKPSQESQICRNFIPVNWDDSTRFDRHLAEPNRYRHHHISNLAIRQNQIRPVIQKSTD